MTDQTTSNEITNELACQRYSKSFGELTRTPDSYFAGFRLIRFIRLYGSNRCDSRRQTPKGPQNRCSTTRTNPSSRVVGERMKLTLAQEKSWIVSRQMSAAAGFCSVATDDGIVPSRRRWAAIPDPDPPAVVASRARLRQPLRDAALRSRRDRREPVPRAADTRSWRWPVARACSRRA